MIGYIEYHELEFGPIDLAGIVPVTQFIGFRKVAPPEPFL